MTIELGNIAVQTTARVPCWHPQRVLAFSNADVE